MKYLVGILGVAMLGACSSGIPATGTLPPIEQDNLEVEMYGPDFCRGLEMYGGVDAFIDYMNQDNPTPVAPDVEREFRSHAAEC